MVFRTGNVSSFLTMATCSVMKEVCLILPELWSEEIDAAASSRINQAAAGLSLVFPPIFQASRSFRVR